MFAGSAEVAYNSHKRPAEQQRQPGARLAKQQSAAPDAKEGTMHYLLIYDLAPDYLERRVLLRAEHLALAWAAHDRGELILAGALAEPVDSAVLLFKGDSPAVAEQFARADPYVHHGLVLSWQVRPWTTVVGADATTPTR